MASRQSEVVILNIGPKEGAAIMAEVRAAHPDATILFGPASHDEAEALRRIREGVAGLRELSDAATPGPWFAQGILLHGPDKGGIDIGPLFGWHDLADSDAALIVASVNYIRSLLIDTEIGAE